MHDLKLIRETPDAFDKGMAGRGLQPQAATILDLDVKRRDAQTRMQVMQSRRNEASKEIGKIKGQGGDATALIEEVQSLKDGLAAAEA